MIKLKILKILVFYLFYVNITTTERGDFLENIEKYLYHGTSGHYVEFVDKEIDVFENILKEKAILSVNNLVERNIIKFPKRKVSFELDTVSVAFHKHNIELYKKYRKELHCTKYEYAWDNYFYSPTFVLDPLITEELGVKINNTENYYCGIMPDELLIKDRIPLEYVKAIAVRISTLGSLNREDYTVGIHEKQYCYIVETMDKYKLDIPLIYLDTGEEITSRNKCMIKKHNN